MSILSTRKADRIDALAEGGTSLAMDALRRTFRSPVAIVGLVIVSLFVVLAAIAPFVAPKDPYIPYPELQAELTPSHIPGPMPGFLLGMRFAVTAAWLSLVVVEQVNAVSGIGYMMELARTYGQTDVIIVGLVVYALLGLSSDGLVRLAQRRALTWKRTLAD